MTDSEIVELGDYCEELMSNEFFNVVARQFDQNKFEDMLSTLPHEFKKREGIYASLTGKRDFFLHMLAIVQQKDAIREKDENELSNDMDAPIDGID